MASSIESTTPSPPQLSNKLKVIGASLPRTGSLSMKTAMNVLGIRCHHMTEVIKNQKSQVPVWTKAFKDGGLSVEEWNDLLDGYEATHDAPACQFVKELAVLNPEAKIIITTRDPKAWAKSLRQTVCWLTPGLTTWMARLVFSKEDQPFINFASELWWGKHGVFAGKRGIDENALPNYVAEIQDFFAKRGESHRVLVYETRSDQDGYDVVCPFLGVPKPEGQKWPNTNASSGSENSKNSDQTFEEITNKRMFKMRQKVDNGKKILGGLGLVGLVGGIAVAASIWQRRR